MLKGATSPSGTITQKLHRHERLDESGSGARASAVDRRRRSSVATNPFSDSARLPRIGDVATVTDGYEPKRVYSYVDGLPAITLNVQKATGASEVTAARSRASRAARRSKRSSPTSQFRVLNVQADFTEQQLLGVLQTLLEGIVVHRHRDAVLPALVAQRAGRDGRDPDLAAA